MTPTVLIVDDHSSFRRYARLLLEEAGFDVVGEAGDGASAIESARRLRPGAVLLDVRLPDASGIDVAAALSSEPCPPVVVLTSSAGAEDLGLPRTGRGFRGFIPKESFSAPAFSRLLAEP